LKEIQAKTTPSDDRARGATLLNRPEPFVNMERAVELILMPGIVTPILRRLQLHWIALKKAQVKNNAVDNRLPVAS
jgi:hypothetical protein